MIKWKSLSNFSFSYSFVVVIDVTMHKFRLTSTYLGKKGFPSLYNYYFFSWRIFVTRIEIYILSEYYLENFAGNESRGNCIPSPAPLMQRRRTITKQPVEIRETPERETEVWSGGTTEEFSSSNPSEQSFFSSLSFFLCCQITGIQSFHLWQIFIQRRLPCSL